MGDPKKNRKKFSSPAILWSKTLIEDDDKLIKEYGLKNKREIWKVKTLNRRFAKDAKKLMVLTTAQAEKEKKQMFARLESYGILSSGARLGDVLGLQATDFLNRRLQTLVCKKGLAASVRQARQFITHGHIAIGDKKITVPSYLVNIAEEPQIRFSENSDLADEEHPERAKGKEAVKKKEVAKEEGEEKAKEKKPKKEKKEKKEVAKKGKPEKKAKEKPAKKTKEEKPAAKEEPKEEKETEEKKEEPAKEEKEKAKEKPEEAKEEQK